MNKELKQTLLAICQKYDIRCGSAPYAPEICMWVTGNGAEIRLDAREIDTSTPSRPVMFKHIHIELRIWQGGSTPTYKEISDIYADEMLARASGVTMPGLDPKRQDLLDIYTAMRDKLDEQRRAEVVAPHMLQDLQRAFDIQLNEKRANAR